MNWSCTVVGAILAIAVLLSLGRVGQSNDRPSFDEMLQREIDNRDFARRVVTVLAEHHKQSPQGIFWAAYVEFERHQQSFYSQLARRHRIAPRGLSITVRAAGTSAAAKLFPDLALATLANATRRYVRGMRRTLAPTEREDQVALRYMIAQEQVQESALEMASRGEFVSGAAILRQFTRSVQSRQYASPSITHVDATLGEADLTGVRGSQPHDYAASRRLR